MPVEPIVAASSAWTAQEGLVFGGMFVAIAVIGGLLVHHLRACGAVTRDLYRELGQMRADLAFLRGKAEGNE